jgi:8-oxo-dGTP diphosphatase
MEEGEDKLECLVREIEEECGVIVEKGKCKELGYIDFYFKDNEKFNQRVFIYRIDEFSGEPEESEEVGKPKEFDVSKIPYAEMIVGDEKFMPFVIGNKKFKGEIHFSEKEGRLFRCVVTEIPDEKEKIKLK